ncbi:ribosome biogenesis protein ytm1 [Agyrium rufum]|nr:ribosome biogenesis protein ytm1 [Agyrium rufum]
MATTTTTQAGANEPDKPAQIRIQLSSQDEDIALPPNIGSILINTNLRRYNLSQLVNALLETPRPVPFEFLINGTFLRTSLDEFLASNGISAETLLQVEYVRAIIPPVYVTSFEQDDWISSVDVLSASSPASPAALNGNAPGSSGHERILTGSYDGLLRVWNMSSQVVATSPPPISNRTYQPICVKAAKFLSPARLVSSGMDRAIRLFNYDEQDPAAVLATITPRLELYGHKASVDSLAVHNPSSRILSASADHTVGIWSTHKNEAPAAPTSLLPNNSSTANKRRKITGTSVPQRGPLSLLTGHTSPVSGVVFKPDDPTVAYSSSWDHTMKTWDLTTGQIVDSRTTAHPLFSIVALQELGLVGVGTAGRNIILIDPRADATRVSAMTLRGHQGTVTALDRDPNEGSGGFGLVSGSLDGTCKVWDVRSSKSGKEGVVGESVATIGRRSIMESGEEGKRRVAGEGVKVFGARWDREVGVVSVGEDKRVQIDRGMGGSGGGGGG